MYLRKGETCTSMLTIYQQGWDKSTWWAMCIVAMVS